MIAQELLDALNQAQNETNLDQVAVWALTNYLQDVWKDSLGKNIRPFDLGQVLSDFFVDLSQHRLPEKITKQTPQTEELLLKFFGPAGGSKSHFWKQCIEIWNVTLEPYPAYAREIKKYFDMLLRSSMQVKRLDPAVAPVRPAVEPIKAQVPAPSVGAVTPEPAADPLVTPSEVEVEPPVVASTPVVPEVPVVPETTVAQRSSMVTGPLHPHEPVKSPPQEDFPVPTGDEAGSAIPAQVPAQKAEQESKTLPRNAYLVLQGTRVIPLNRSFIKIGRQLDNHIILEDPRVSRSHAVIKVINDRFVIFDMNSTGGTFVNGQSTSQSVLYPGDVVSLAGVVFIFSQEMPAKPGDMKIIELGSPYAADRPTAIIQREEIKAAKKIGPKDLPDLPKTGPLSKFH